MSDLEEFGRSLHRYEYKPLGNATSEIRVIHLLPDEQDSAIKIRLHAHAFDNASYPQYDALSYTWGLPDNPLTILVESDGEYRTLSVTQNCCTALHNLRSESGVRALWIDAVCINQNDLDERAQQVSIMADIYTKALHTTIWLGEASEKSHVAMAWMEQLGQNVTWEPGSDQRPLTDEFEWVRGDRAYITVEETEAMIDMVSRPWFDRLWVWQEVRLSNSRATLTCGTATVPWRSFDLTVRSLYGKLSPQTVVLNSLGDRLDRLLERLRWVGGSVINRLNNVRTCSCTDERDRIYATQSSTPTEAEIMTGHSTEPAKVVPDYRSTVSEVYTDFILRYIESGKDLDFFVSITGEKRRVGNTSPLDDLPSWIPDWSQPRATNPFRFKAHGYCNTTGIHADRRLLRTRGIVDSRVQSCTAFRYSLADRTTFHEITRALHDLVEAKFDEILDDARLERLCDVLLAGCYKEAFDTPPPLAHPMNDAKFIMRQLPHIDQTNAVHFRLVYQMAWNCHGRSLFQTDSGDMGLGPVAMRPGDEVVCFPAYSYPVVLRGLQQGRHRFVGCACMEGFRYIEKLWGALPSTHEPIHTPGPQGYRLGYRNRDTGDIAVMDPRVTELRPDWEDPHFAMIYYEERDGRTGESRWSQRDMRCTPDELVRKRGITLQEFTLE